jgi:hypothetical protein
VARGGRIHSPKALARDQDSLIFARCIDYSGHYGEIKHPVLSIGRIAGFDGAACAAKKR